LIGDLSSGQCWQSPGGNPCNDHSCVEPSPAIGLAAGDPVTARPSDHFFSARLCGDVGVLYFGCGHRYATRQASGRCADNSGRICSRFCGPVGYVAGRRRRRRQRAIETRDSVESSRVLVFLRCRLRCRCEADCGADSSCRAGNVAAFWKPALVPVGGGNAFFHAISGRRRNRVAWICATPAHRPFRARKSKSAAGSDLGCLAHTAILYSWCRFLQAILPGVWVGHDCGFGGAGLALRPHPWKPASAHAHARSFQ
jgi:hypothetical protein